MTDIDIIVVDVAGNKTEEATVPSAIASGRIISRLVELMEMPISGPDGLPISYKFQHKQTGAQISDDQTLESAGVQNGDVLRLVPEITAG